MVRHVVEHFGGGEAPALQTQSELVIRHAFSLTLRFMRNRVLVLQARRDEEAEAASITLSILAVC
jgi:hypothetical protein